MHLPETIDRKIFFDLVRESLFDGALNEEQVAGMEASLDIWALYSLGLGKSREILPGVPDTRHLAYIFATSYHETGRKMVAVRETFARFDKDVKLSADYADVDPESGERFYGRGQVQLTHKSNFATMGELFGIDLVAAPDIALGPWASSLIMFAGMLRGMFTGKSLSDYINASGCDYVEARRVVNGTDRADMIAGYAEEFEAALNEASEGGR